MMSAYLLPLFCALGVTRPYCLSSALLASWVSQAHMMLLARCRQA